MTNGTDTTKFKLNGTDQVEDIGKESRVASNCVRKGTNFTAEVAE